MVVHGNFYFLSLFGSSKAGIDRRAGVDRPSSYCVILVNGAQPWKLISLHNLHTFLNQILCLKVGAKEYYGCIIS
jgi:predicted nucleotidyltransferase